MRRFFTKFILGSFLALGFATPALAAPWPGALCHPEEEVLFSCRLQMNNGLISLCASPHVSKGRGYLQYRAGDFNHVELEFPQRREEYRALFNYMHVFPKGMDRVGLSFTNNGAVHELYSRHDTPPNPPLDEAGLRISAPNAPEAVQLCQPPFIDNLKRLEELF